jgi:dTDP-4-amino-4,6-dideoxygalactose transaminase
VKGKVGLVIRGAVWLALRAMGLGPGSRLAMPAYHCGSEVEAARLAGVDVRFYRVDASLTVDEDDMAKVAADADATYVISHFGFPPPPPPPGARVVADLAHGLFSSGPGGPLGAGAEAAVFCPRKSLGVPDGGAVLSTAPVTAPGGHPPPRRVLRSVAALAVGRAALSPRRPVRRLAARALGRASRGDAALAQGRLTETVIGEWDLQAADLETAASGPSWLTRRIAVAADGEAIRARRRLNYERLARDLGPACPEPLRELPPGTCPLYFPVLAPERATAMAGLLARGVRAVEIWPVPHPLLDRDRFAELEPLRRGLVALPVHHDLEPWHADIVARAATEVLRP